MVYKSFSRQESGWQRLFLPFVFMLLAGAIYAAYIRPFQEPTLLFPTFSAPALSFVPNTGQSDPAVHFIAQSPLMALFFTEQGLTFSGAAEGEGEAALVDWHFVGAETAEISGADPLPGVANYFKGEEAAGWQTRLPTFGTVHYNGLYPGVDARYHGGPGTIEATFDLVAGVDPAVLQWRFEGATLRIEAGSGEAMLYDENGRPLLRLTPPVLTTANGGNIRYILTDDGVLGLTASDYDTSRPLSLLISAVPLDGFYVVSVVTDVVTDSNGAIYVVGYTRAADFPIKYPVQEEYGGGYFDAFVSKFSGNGRTLLFSTYLGGYETDIGRAIALDPSGAIIIGGTTASSNFPQANPLPGSMLRGYEDGFVTRLAPNGGQILFSSFLGGNQGDDVLDVAVDGPGNIYVAGRTSSDDFPVVNAVQPASAGGFSDGFVTKILAGSHFLLFSTYLGGENSDELAALALDQNGDIFLTGTSNSTNFPRFPAAASPPEAGFYSKVVAVKMAGNGSSLLFSRGFGGSFSNGGTAVTVAPNGDPIITGITDSPDFPLVSPIQATLAGNDDAFVMKLDAGSGDLLFSTFLGGETYDYGLGVTADSAGNIYLTGLTESGDFPIINPLPQSGYPWNGDAFVSRISTAGALNFSTFLGGNHVDKGQGIALDTSGRAIVVGSTSSVDFPVVNAFQPEIKGDLDGFMSRIDLQTMALETSTFLGGSSSGYLFPTDVSLTGFGETAGSPADLLLLIAALLTILVLGLLLVRRVNRQ